jgi:hypothetical protein
MNQPTPVILTVALHPAGTTQSTVEATASPFIPVTPEDRCLSAHWQVAADPRFMTILAQTFKDQGPDWHRWRSPALIALDGYYVRVRYTGQVSGPTEWSFSRRYDQGSKALPAPTLTVLGLGPVGPHVTLMGSAFTPCQPDDALRVSHWQLSQDPYFIGVDQEHQATTGLLTEWTAPNLAPNTLYYARVAYQGSLSDPSPWSEPVGFITAPLEPQGEPEANLTGLSPEAPPPTYPAVRLKGPSAVPVNAAGQYTLINYDPAIPYTVEAEYGTVQQHGPRIVYTAPSMPGLAGFRVLNTPFAVWVTPLPY